MYERTRERFDQTAEAYSSSPLFARGEDLGWILEEAAPSPQDRLLDIGTGAGHTAFALAPLVEWAIGLDLAPAMVKTARANARERGQHNFEAVLGNAEQLPFPDMSFEIITCRYAAHHFQHPERTLREAGRGRGVTPRPRAICCVAGGATTMLPLRPACRPAWAAPGSPPSPAPPPRWLLPSPGGRAAGGRCAGLRPGRPPYPLP